MPIPDLVAHVRTWARLGANRAYARFLERVATMSDAQLADIVRFAKTTRGAEMLVARHTQQGGYL